MKFNEWLQDQNVLVRRADQREVEHVTFDSREIGPGWAFMAISGTCDDGAKFIPEALRAGAVAILCDRDIELPRHVPFARLGNGRQTAALLARKLYAQPDMDMSVIGVTGTNGKTTTTMLIRQLVHLSGVGCGLIGGVINAGGANKQKATLTTPDSCTFYRLLRTSANAGDLVLAAEISSHSLAMARVYGAHFRFGIFTNLTQDHLDFHGDMESYFQAKMSLFKQCDIGLVNIDDAFGQRLSEQNHFITYSINKHSDYQATDIKLYANKTSFNLLTPTGSWLVYSPLVGRFNAYNLLAALAVLSEAGFSLNSLIAHVPNLVSAPGRLDKIDCGQPFGIIIDYAHTPDALEKLLLEGKRLLADTKGRLHILFGCGGNRDRTKRPLMAQIAANYADVLWHTSDNSRWEDPEFIIDDSAVGVPSEIRKDINRYHKVVDRAEAIKLAIHNCQPGDLLLLAGKGHEEYQDIMGIKHPYSDSSAAETVLSGLTN